MSKELITVQYSPAQIREIQMMLREIPRQMGNVMRRGINKTAKVAQTSVVRKMAAEINTKRKEIKGRILLSKATNKLWEARLSLSKKRFPLAAFGARQTIRGVSYKIKRGGKRQKIDHAFLADMPARDKTGKIMGYHHGVFKRKEKDGKRVARLPVQELFGPSIGVAFENAKDLVQATIQETSGNLAKNLRHEVEYVLWKRRKVGAA